MSNRRQFLQGAAATVVAGLTFPQLLLEASHAQTSGAPGGTPPRGTAAKPNLASFNAAAAQLLARMTLEEKVGQMVQAEQSALQSLDDIETYALGSLLSGGDSDPKSGNRITDWANLYDSLQKRALQTRLAIPVLFGIDAVHGHSNVIGATIFPHNIGLGCTRSADLVEQAARITAREVKATGIQWAFAPCVAVARDERWGRTYESFGETPELARELGAAAVRGLQGSSLTARDSVLACAKHYAGDGGTVYGTGVPNPDGERILDRGDVRLSEAELKALHMQGYISTIAAGVLTIMPSYNSWNGQKCSGSKRLLMDILKGELGFQGFLISDYNAIDELPGDYKSQIAQSANAGMDMFMVPDKYRQLHGLLVQLVREGTVPQSRIDDAVTRILRVKFAIGSLNKNQSQFSDKGLQAVVGSPAHREVARKCARQSVVLLKNFNKALPLAKKAKRIHVGGKSADNIGNQCGGWTITWQGNSGAVTTGGTTILGAIKNAASKNTRVSYAADGTGGSGADVGVVVIGETPYAETRGDRSSLSLDPADVTAVRNMKAAGLKVVVVLLSGRPLILDSILSYSDAIVAAWLPGTEGAGVTDVLFGDYRPTGKLSHSWPRSVAQLPLSVGDPNYNPLYPYGFGLTY